MTHNFHTVMHLLHLHSRKHLQQKIYLPFTVCAGRRNWYLKGINPYLGQEVPVKIKEAAKAWINGKMMPALLIEKFIGSVDFSPSGENGKKQEHMERNQTGISVNFYSGHSKN